MSGLGEGIAQLIVRTEHDLETGLFWYYAVPMRISIINRIVSEMQDVHYPQWADRAKDLYDRIEQHLQEVMTFVVGDCVTSLYTLPLKAEKGVPAVIVAINDIVATIDVEGNPEKRVELQKVLLTRVQGNEHEIQKKGEQNGTN